MYTAATSEFNIGSMKYSQITHVSERSNFGDEMMKLSIERFILKRLAVYSVGHDGEHANG